MAYVLRSTTVKDNIAARHLCHKVLWRGRGLQYIIDFAYSCKKAGSACNEVALIINTTDVVTHCLWINITVSNDIDYMLDGSRRIAVTGYHAW